MTFYDDRTGERVELSVATYANWVAKTASLLQDELGLEHGDRLLLDLPPHWLGPVWLGAAWSLGLVVTPPGGPGLAPSGPLCGRCTPPVGRPEDRRPSGRDERDHDEHGVGPQQAGEPARIVRAPATARYRAANRTDLPVA